jgi:hypothetical protein
MVLCVTPYVRYLVRPISDHTEVRYSFETISHGPLISYLGYMPSRGTTGGSPPTFLFVVWPSLPPERTFWFILRYDLVCPFSPVFEGNFRGKPQFRK